MAKTIKTRVCLQNHVYSARREERHSSIYPEENFKSSLQPLSTAWNAVLGECHQHDSAADYACGDEERFRRLEEGLLERAWFGTESNGDEDAAGDEEDDG